MEERRELIIDHLGSPVMVVKYFYNTEVALEIKYDSFGKEIPTPPNTYPPPKAEASRLCTPPRRGIVGSAPLLRGDFPFGFAGGIWDKDTKLIRFGVRDYDPEIGRWTSVEPLGFSGSRNWYVYAGNDGVNYLDLDGRNPVLIERAIKIFIGLLEALGADILLSTAAGNFQNSYYMKIMNRVAKVCPNPVEIDEFLKENIEHPIMDGWDYLQDSYSEFGEDLYDFFNDSNMEGMNNYYRYKANQSLNRTEERLRKRLGL